MQTIIADLIRLMSQFYSQQKSLFNQLCPYQIWHTVKPGQVEKLHHGDKLPYFNYACQKLQSSVRNISY